MKLSRLHYSECAQDVTLWRTFCQKAYEPREVVGANEENPGPGAVMVNAPSYWRQRLKRWRTRTMRWRSPTVLNSGCMPRLFLHRACIASRQGAAFIFGGTGGPTFFISTLYRCTVSPQPLADGSPVLALEALEEEPSTGQRPTPRSASSLVALDDSDRPLPSTTTTSDSNSSNISSSSSSSSNGASGALAPEKLYLFGGSGQFGDFFQDTWCLSVVAGASVAATTSRGANPVATAAAAAAGIGRQFVSYERIDTRAQPGGRWGHTCVAFRGRTMYLFGGTCPGTAFNDLWRFDTRRREWRRVRVGSSVRAPITQGSHDGSGSDDAGNTGSDEDDDDDDDDDDNEDDHYHNNAPGSSSSALPVSSDNGSDLPAGRGGHMAVTSGDWMYIFGGNTVDESFDDMWRINLAQLEDAIASVLPPLRASEHPTTGSGPGESPSGLDADAADAVSPDETGESYDALTSEGGELCCLDAMWERIEPSQSPSTLWPPARIGHAGVSIGHRIYMYGGRDYINRVFQPGVWIFDTAKLEWTCPPMRAAGGVDMPRLRTGHCAIGHGDGIFYLGGLADGNGLTLVNDAIFLDVLGVGACPTGGAPGSTT